MSHVWQLSVKTPCATLKVTTRVYGGPFASRFEILSKDSFLGIFAVDTYSGMLFGLVSCKDVLNIHILAIQQLYIDVIQGPLHDN